MIINKQITIIITRPKPVVSPKLIYDELQLRFLGTGEWEEAGGLLYSPPSTEWGQPLHVQGTALPASRSPRRGSQKGLLFVSLVPPLPCLAQLSFLDTLLAFLIQLFF